MQKSNSLLIAALLWVSILLMNTMVNPMQPDRLAVPVNAEWTAVSGR